MIIHSLTLLLPALAHPDGGWPAMPALQALLSKGEREETTGDLAALLFAHFAVPARERGEWPLAPLCALGDGLAAANGWWLRADPVHLVADRDQLYLAAAAALQLTQAEADALVAELNRVYADDGWHFFAATPQRWYLRLAQPLAMTTTPTAEALGRRVGEVLPQGEDAMGWQRVMTEVQMLLHTSPVNAARLQQGLMAVNGLWFWGGGVLPQGSEDTGWQQVVTDHPLARGLARLSGIQSHSMASATLAEGEGRVLWVMGEGQTDPQRLEQDYCSPLLAMLQAGQLSQLVIELPGAGRWRIDRKALRRWWRRRKPLAALLKGTA